VFLRGGRGLAEQPEPPRRLDGPVLADGPSDALGQLVATGLRPPAPLALTVGGSSIPWQPLRSFPHHLSPRFAG